MDRGAIPEPTLVADPVALEALVEALEHERAIALDTESNSFHVYRERVCLLQISTGRGDWIVDPLAVDPSPLGAVLVEASREVVLHGADYDVRCLRREYGWRLPNLFDTMIAARRAQRPQLGLAALVEVHFGVRMAKDFQRSDWGRRPLSPEQLKYAALDTHYLLALRDLLLPDLEARGQLDEARREFARIAAVEPRPKSFDADGWRKIRAARDLDAAGRAILRALWIAREERASALDKPPFKVLSEEGMLEIARRRPTTTAELERIPGVTAVVVRRMGDAALAAVRAVTSAGA